jgi:aspartyl/asparaginyl-tRNA synthetase
LRINEDGWTIGAMDVPVRGIGKIIGGNGREERLRVLDHSMVDCGIEREPLRPTFPSPACGGGLGWGHLRRYGTVPHAGLDLGRASPTSPASPNVRDAIPLQQTPGNARY